MRVEPTRMLEMLKPKASLEFLCAFLWSPRMLASRVCGDEGKLVASLAGRLRVSRAWPTIQGWHTGRSDLLVAPWSCLSWPVSHTD